jgi:hypothetical protein
MVEISTGGTIAIGIFAALGIAATLLFLWAKGSDSGLGYAIMGGIRGFFFAIANFIPLGFMLFGIIADIINQEFRNTISTILGMIAVILNNLASRLFTIGNVPMAGGAVPDQVWCTIPGLNALESRALPMTITSTWAIMMYYITFAAAKRPASQNISLGVGLGGLSLIQIMTFAMVGCKDYFIPIGGTYVWNVVGAIVLGTVIGTGAYGVVNNLYPAYAPLGFVVSPTTGGGLLSVTNPMASTSSKTGGSCSAIEGEDAMVCEAYKNGQLVTESLA